MSKKPVPVAVAKAAMADYIKFKNQKAKIEAKQKKAKAKLVLFAATNRDKFDEDGNYKMRGGHLHFGDETLVLPCQGFQLSAFIEKYPELVGLYKKVVTKDGEELITLDKDKVKTSAIKAMLDSEEGRKKLVAENCVSLTEMETFTIVTKK